MRRRRETEVSQAAADERRKQTIGKTDWFEPAQLLIWFGRQAVSWFDRGTDDLKRCVVTAVGSNYTLTDKKLDGEAKKPFMLRVEEARILYGWTFLDDIRTRFERKDPDLLRMIAQVRLVKAKAEEGANTELPLPSVPGGKESTAGS